MSEESDQDADPGSIFSAKKLTEKQPWTSAESRDAVRGDETYPFPGFFDATDGLANQGKATICIQHVPSGKRAYFKAFITTFTESYKMDWASESVFGRTDPIYLYKQTTRQMTLGFKVPAASPGEAFENLARLQSLIQFFYPNYANIGSATSIAQSPLCRVEVLNLTPSRTVSAQTFNHQYRGNKGALCIIQDCNIAHNLENSEAGVYEHGGGAYLPKFMEVTLSLSILNEESLGWGRNNFSDPHFPYGVDLGGSEGAQKSRRSTEQSTFGNYPSPLNTSRRELADPNSETNRAIAAELERQQVYDEAEARYTGIFGELLYSRDQRISSEGGRLERRRANTIERVHSNLDSGFSMDSRRTQRSRAAASDALARKEAVAGRVDAYAASFIDEVD